MKVESVEIRRMQLKDVGEVVKIEREVFSMAWTPSMFLKEITAEEESLPLVVSSGHEFLGYAIVWRLATRLHLANIAVDKRFRRRGIGSRLIHQIFAEAKARDCARVSLETRVSNRDAIRLFVRMGFRTVAISHGYYTDNDEDALVMVRQIPGDSESSPRAAEVSPAAEEGDDR